MLFCDVLSVLHKNIEAIGVTHVESFQKIFQGILYENDFNIDDNVKKYFSGSRYFPQKVFKTLCNPEAFQFLCDNIQNNYLSIAGNRLGIFETLSEFLTDCPYVRKLDIEKIIAACDYTQTAELARFIAACLICGNYNSIQEKSKKSLIREKYGLNIDFMLYNTSAVDLQIKKDLWEAAQNSYLESHRKGNRFHALNIIERLLPNGYITNTYFRTNGETHDGKVAPLIELCKNTDDNIAIVGDGGIGKTTFLQHMMKDIFLHSTNEPRKYMTNIAVPFFIELNRCPSNIRDWYEPSLKKTNFITRYIGQMKENHATLDAVTAETLITVEKALQRNPVDGKPQYLLLLDGFNEVCSDRSVRTYLSNEISILSTYPNVRIITTSRDTQSAYYASKFRNIRLVGLKKEEITDYLEHCKIPEYIIGNAMNCASLVKCLRIPLYLCMFSAEKPEDDFLPETAGEILYSFFHRNSAFYNARRRLSETMNCALTEKQVAFVLDFILPYIGWVFEEKEIFSMNETQFASTIEESVQNTIYLLCRGATNPYKDFDYKTSMLRETALSFFQGDNVNTKSIITCIYDYLGLVYQYQINDGEYSERNRFAFCHHHFRDYFSAIWNVQLLSMLQCIDSASFSATSSDTAHVKSFRYYLDRRYWQTQKVQFISEILMEHRNRPYLNEKSLNWSLPQKKYDKQKVLTNLLDFCRNLHKEKIETYHFLQNILSVILFGRKEYSGLKLDHLDLHNCRFFNITCSRKGQTSTLAVDFSGSILSENNFISEDHLNNVLEYVYCNGQCFTIDDSGVIKCWDVLSGKMEYELHSEDPLGPTDFSRKGYIKVSKNRRWLGVKVQNNQAEDKKVYIHLYDLENPEEAPKKIQPKQQHSILTYFNFTDDSNSLLMLCDRTTVYCIDIESQSEYYCAKFDLYKQSELYADSAESTIFAHTAEYNTYETDDGYMNYWENDDAVDKDNVPEWDGSDDDFEHDTSLISCAVVILDPNTESMQVLQDYDDAPGKAPAFTYISHSKSFIYYNYTEKRIEQYRCDTKSVWPIFEGIDFAEDYIPQAIYQNPNNENEIYILDAKVCFNADISTDGGASILMTYSIEGVEKLLPNSDESGELEFYPYAAPNMSRFVVRNNNNTYEWDADNDTLLLKYNCAFYDCTNLYTNTDRDKFFLIHKYNGISVFGGNPLILENQYCFRETGYHIGDSCFDSKHNIIALVFVRPDHEKIIVMDLQTGKQEDVFSIIDKGETISKLCFSKDCKYLLITTQYRCVECKLESKEIFEVVESSANERYVAAQYVKDEIEIAVAEHSCEKEPRIQPYCIYYTKNVIDGSIQYYPSWYYIIPELKQELFQYLIHYSNDFGYVSGLNKYNEQQHFITQGFFLEQKKELSAFFYPKCYTWRGKQKKCIEKTFAPFDMIYVKHSTEIINQYGVGKNLSCSYLYVSEDMTEAIITDNRVKLFYCNNFKQLSYDKLRAELITHAIEANQYAFWDYAVPQNEVTMIGCSEFYHISTVQTKNDKISHDIEYYPGISISGCKFDNVVADEYAMKIIKANGI